MLESTNNQYSRPPLRALGLRAGGTLSDEELTALAEIVSLLPAPTACIYPTQIHMTKNKTKI